MFKERVKKAHSMVGFVFISILTFACVIHLFSGKGVISILLIGQLFLLSWLIPVMHALFVPDVLVEKRKIFRVLFMEYIITALTFLLFSMSFNWFAFEIKWFVIALIVFTFAFSGIAFSTWVYYKKKMLNWNGKLREYQRLHS